MSGDAANRNYIVNIGQDGYDKIFVILSINNVATSILHASYIGLKIQDHLPLVDNSVVGGLVIDGTYTAKATETKITVTLNGYTTAAADCVASDHALTLTR